MALLIHRIINPISPFEISQDLWLTVYKHDFSLEIAKFVYTAIIVLFALIYFSYRKVLFWRNRYLHWKNLALMHNKTVHRLMKEKFELNKQIRELERRVRTADSTDINREELVQDFVRIIRALPVNHTDEAIHEIAILAEKFDIKITLNLPKRKRKVQHSAIPRKQPKRSAAPKNFHFSEDEDEDDKSKDPDFKPRK